jgi:hypothetical protein
VSGRGVVMAEDRRLALDEPATLHPNDWSSLEVLLLECSETGFRAACEASVRIGTLVTLEIAGLGPVRAHVAWCRSGQLVGRFCEPLDLDRARFLSINESAMLARLLKERSAAYLSGRADEESRLRRRIRNALPVRKGRAAEL